MSNNATQSHDNDGISGKSIHPNKPSWMTHWSQTSYKSSPQTGDHFPHGYKSKGDNHECARSSFPGHREISSDFLKPGKRFREVVEASQVKFLNKEGIDSCSFPVFDLYQNRESALGSKDRQLSISSKEVLKSPVDHIPRYNNLTLGSESSLRGNHFHHEGTLENFGRMVKYQHFHENNKLDASRPFQGNFVESTTNMMPGFNSEKPEDNNQLDSRLPMKEQFRGTVTRVEHERENYRNFASLFMRGEKMKKHLNSIS